MTNWVIHIFLGGGSWIATNAFIVIVYVYNMIFLEQGYDREKESTHRIWVFQVMYIVIYIFFGIMTYF